ncbi:hypothetical protein Y1Q_0008926 [Alligator mississippiensis]|uniref:Uncharacterized protein n=1 Tax=Alligator mississippiensis TaxID=8496 RepID=A0A151NK97_ALLMI|nr:hypothetical protein Y1Q_0008926 [Alligator mississippiensis]
MRAKCKQCNKEMQGLVARMKHLEKCSFSGENCFEDDEWNMSEHGGSPGGCILNIQDSDYPSSTSSLSTISELPINDTSVPVKCMSRSTSPVAKRKKISLIQKPP